MSTEANRATALRMVATLGAGAPDPTLQTDDAIWWAPGRGAFSRDVFAGIAAGFAAMFEGPSTIAVLGVTAQDDRVAIEARGHARLKSGRLYENRYHYLFLFREGKICEARLYNDTWHANDIRG